MADLRDFLGGLLLILHWITRTEAVCSVPSYFLPAGPQYGDRQDVEAQRNNQLPLPIPATAGDTILSAVQSVRIPGQIKIIGSGGRVLYVHLADTTSYTPIDNINSYQWDRVSTDDVILRQVAFLVNQANNINTFYPRFAYICTWLCLTGAGLGTFASFQAVVASDGPSTYLIASYESELPTTAQFKINNSGDFTNFLVSSASTRLLLETNACQDGQWVWQLTQALVPPAATPPCGSSLTDWSEWSGYCTVCGGCGQRSRSQQSYFGGVATESGCPATKCKIGVHPRGEWIISRKNRWIRRNRRCCYDFRFSEPKLMPFARRCYALKCRGWEK